MASGVFKKTMVYLGLVDDEYDEADGYEPWAPQPTRQATRVVTEEPEEPLLVPPSATIRTLTRANGARVRPGIDRRLATVCRTSDPCQIRARVPGSTWWRRRSSPTARRSPTSSSAANR